MSSQPTPISATVTFDVVGSNLVIVLTNTSSGNPGYHNPDLLEGVFFSSNTPLTLSPVSAALTAGSPLVNGSIPAGQLLGDQWQYRFSATGFSNGPLLTTDQYLIGAAGFSGMLGHGNFGSNSQNVGGLNFGIVGTDWDAAKASNGTLNQGPFEYNSVSFVLSGLPVGFSLSSILDATFVYGTAPDSLLADDCLTCGTTSVPEPAAFSLFGIGLIGLIGIGRRRKHPLIMANSKA